MQWPTLFSHFHSNVARERPHWDYVFLFSNEPVPNLAEKVRCAIQAGRRVVVAYLARPAKALHMEAMPGATVLAYPVGFGSVNVRRLITFWPTLWWLRRHVLSRVTENCDVYVDALDLLAMAQLIGLRRRWKFRFEVRDLHNLQLKGDMVSRLVQGAEQIMLKRLHTLVLTSEAHSHAYYQHRYTRPPVYVDNVPPRDAWQAFTRRSSGQFIVGFIGVLRYLPCLEALIDAARRLNEKGLPVKVRLAGGGLVDEMRAYAEGMPFIEILGPFRYRDSACHLFEDVDLIYSVYDAEDANVRLAIAGKYYEAQIAGIPMLVAEDTFLESLVVKGGFGKAVRHADAEDVAEKIEEAYRRSEWYQSARRTLAKTDLEKLFINHDKSIRKATLSV
jgi:glycosyltransferase involved in cell wall biosynthesis